MIPNVYAVLAAHAGVTDIVDDRIDRAVSPQDVTEPRITWHVVTNSPLISMSQRPAMDHVRIQVDCWSRSQSEARQLAQATRDALEGVTHVVFGPVELFEPDSSIYRWVMDASCWHER